VSTTRNPQKIMPYFGYIQEVPPKKNFEPFSECIDFTGKKNLG
jgi:hypothetical protein